MITIETYENLVREVINIDLHRNPSQSDGVRHVGDDILLISAGPGSGKTTVLVLRALRHVFVDDVLPDQILITTFTRKAAKELRTRWLNWGTLLTESLNTNPDFEEAISRIDLNRCRIDTLDSLAQQAITDNRLPGEVAPIVVQGAASRLILKRASFSNIYSTHQNILDPFLSRYTFEGDSPRNRGEALAVAKSLCERLLQDRVDLTSFARSSRAHQLIVDILHKYRNSLQETNLLDFAAIELKLLERLQDDTLQDWARGISALLIDEYQDTNPLQESIYFETIASARPLVTIVGDDDQSMYRFRGGSVELFTQFRQRCATATGRQTRRIDMVLNFRSSEEIVQFYNKHILNDPEFAPARISPAKPEVVAQRTGIRMPILGMFRESPIDLANSLATWLHQFITNRVTTISDGTRRYELTLSQEGDLGDCVLLAHTVEEVKYNRFNREADIRFPSYLREAMSRLGLKIFNPRGRALRTILSVQQLLGLVLLCLDPEGSRSEAAFPTNEARFFLAQWRNSAQSFIAQNPSPADDGGLRQFIDTWGRVSLGQSVKDFPMDWPVLELIFTLITWIPGFQNDPEHQVWLEAIARTIGSAGMASAYGMQILQSDQELRERSRERIIADALFPIAENEVDVDEDIMPSVPRDRLQLMTIHQSKGLEFPLVIVDVGSQFTGNWAKQRFLRYPESISNVVRMEDDVEPHLPSPLRGNRDPLDRTFDDLTRLYYVAYSRPQTVLILIGCEKCLAYGHGSSLEKKIIPNIALGWRRNRTWPWRQAYTGRRPPIRVDAPLILIE